VNAQRVRADLDYRLAVLEVRLPSLRAQIEDIPRLVAQIVASLGMTDKPEAARLRTPEFLEQLMRHDWPGNVRELRNYVERSLAYRDENLPPLGGAPAATDEAPISLRRSLKDARDAVERRYLQELMRQHGDNLARAARVAGVERAFLYRLLSRHGLRPER
jgi:DNA-binding NtrC family response regulator